MIFVCQGNTDRGSAVTGISKDKRGVAFRGSLQSDRDPGASELFLLGLEAIFPEIVIS